MFIWIRNRYPLKNCGKNCENAKDLCILFKLSNMLLTLSNNTVHVRALANFLQLSKKFIYFIYWYCKIILINSTSGTNNFFQWTLKWILLHSGLQENFLKVNFNALYFAKYKEIRKNVLYAHNPIHYRKLNE